MRKNRMICENMVMQGIKTLYVNTAMQGIETIYENTAIHWIKTLYENTVARENMEPRKSIRPSGGLPRLSGCLFLLFGCLLLSGCSSSSGTAAGETDGQGGQEVPVKIGPVLEVEAPEQLTLLENKDMLAADGLYYAAWGTGDSVPYENSDGDTIDLYDAQLYLLAGESSSPESAEKDCRIWLASAEDNYDILETDTVTCGGQDYTLITYDCISRDTPYDRGVSAFGVCGSNAVCAELTCVEKYEEDLTTLLKEFLNGCQYSQQ